jgi:hypothetical protein
MPKFSQILITLPLMVLPLALAAPKPGFAETVGMERALELLAKSKVVDSRCQVLSVSERDELSSYVARAEVAAAEKTTLEMARSALKAGTNQGQSASCGAEASQEVRDTLAAAREAIRSAEKTTRTALAEEPPQAIRTGTPKASLSAYNRIIETYFVERRCAYLSQRKMNAFYKAVVKDHRAVISEFGKAAVSKVMKSAEARSNYQSCNGAGEARVKAGFAEIASR